MDDGTALDGIPPNRLRPPSTDLSPVWAKVTQRLWINPTQFPVTTWARVMAEGALTLRARVRPSLPAPSRRGPKPVYPDSRVRVMALIQGAGQFRYEEAVDYFRAHSEAACAAGFPAGCGISVGQYGKRRRALGILPVWFFFIAMVWQLTRRGVM